MTTTILRFEDDEEYIEVKSFNGGVLIGSARLNDDQVYTAVQLDSEELSNLIAFLQSELSKINENDIIEQ